MRYRWAWQVAKAEQRQSVQTLLFEEGLAYDQQSNSLNHPNSCLFSVLEQVSTANLLLASPTGFEPVRLQDGPLIPKHLGHADH